MQVYGAGGKTTPKAGRNGTGSYYPNGTPLLHHVGNVFPGQHILPQDFTHLSFGDPSRAGVSTVVGQNRVNSRGIHPNKSQYNVATQVLTPALAVSSSNDTNNLQPVTPLVSGTGPQGPTSGAKQLGLAMPHERNTNSASGTKKKPNPYRTTFGASQSMPDDSAFVHQPNANYRHSVRPMPKSAVEAIKKTASFRTFAHATNPLPKGGGVNPSQQHRTPPASFVSRNNMWSDPNNSFVGSANTPAGAGTGRWSIVKKGVV